MLLGSQKHEQCCKFHRCGLTNNFSLNLGLLLSQSLSSYPSNNKVSLNVPHKLFLLLNRYIPNRYHHLFFLYSRLGLSVPQEYLCCCYYFGFFHRGNCNCCGLWLHLHQELQWFLICQSLVGMVMRLLPPNKFSQMIKIYNEIF